MMSNVSTSLGALVIGGAAALVLPACHHASVKPAGQTSFAFIEPPSAPPQAKAEVMSGPRQAVDVLELAEPIQPLVSPVYPKIALGTTTAPVTVRVRIQVGLDGRVHDVGPSPLGIDFAPTSHGEEFQAAVAAALRQWRFIPAEQRHLEPSKRGEKEIWLVTHTEPTECTLDVAFTFSASGDVLAQLPR